MFSHSLYIYLERETLFLGKEEDCREERPVPVPRSPPVPVAVGSTASTCSTAVPGAVNDRNAFLFTVPPFEEARAS